MEATSDYSKSDAVPIDEIRPARAQLKPKAENFQQVWEIGENLQKFRNQIN